MIIFINEDRAYFSWVTRHRQGYVIDGRRKSVGSFVMHHATCRAIKGASSRGHHWTTGAKIKACSLNRQELETWVTDENGASIRYCEDCQPGESRPPGNAQQAHVTKLGRDVLDYVIEAALIHMERECGAYRLTTGDIAGCLRKTPAQISSVVHQLIDDGFLVVPGNAGDSRSIPAKRTVHPTVMAMRTLESFQDQSDCAIQSELAKLGA
jgi:hypothetical protein